MEVNLCISEWHQTFWTSKGNDGVLCKMERCVERDGSGIKHIQNPTCSTPGHRAEEQREDVAAPDLGFFFSISATLPCLLPPLYHNHVSYLLFLLPIWDAFRRLGVSLPLYTSDYSAKQVIAALAVAINMAHAHS